MLSRDWLDGSRKKNGVPEGTPRGQAAPGTISERQTRGTGRRPPRKPDGRRQRRTGRNGNAETGRPKAASIPAPTRAGNKRTRATTKHEKHPQKKRLPRAEKAAPAHTHGSGRAARGRALPRERARTCASPCAARYNGGSWRRPGLPNEAPRRRRGGPGAEHGPRAPARSERSERRPADELTLPE